MIAIRSARCRLNGAALFVTGYGSSETCRTPDSTASLLSCCDEDRLQSDAIAKLSGRCALTLVIKADHSRVKSGEVLYVTGAGFTPGRAVIAHLIRPDKTEYNTLRLRANAAGELVHKIDTVMLDIGTFELWVDDEVSKATSNRIQFTVEANLRDV